MLQITPQMKILVAVEPADFRKGIDGLVRVCKDSELLIWADSSDSDRAT